MTEQALDPNLLENLNNATLQSYLAQMDIVINHSNIYISQFTKFISDLNALQVKYNVIVMNIDGNLNVEVPANMSQAIESEVVKKVGILDRLCIQRCGDIEAELSKGRSLENLIKQINPKYTSRISGQIAEFARLSGAFK